MEMPSNLEKVQPPARSKSRRIAPTLTSKRNARRLFLVRGAGEAV